jgi:hypothetical protein
MRKRNSKTNKRALRILKGFICEWQDSDPSFETKELKNVRCDHKNFVHRTCVDEIFETSKPFIFKMVKMQWRITITTVFSYNTGNDRHEDTLEFYGVFNSLNDFAMSIIRQQRLKGDPERFCHIEFKAECVDLKPKHKSKVDPESELIKVEVMA